jgi:hypothetical protein
MLAATTREILNRIRTGQFDLSEVSDLEQLSMGGLIRDLADSYPITFQERSIKSKLEVGLARSVRYELSFARQPRSTFPAVRVSTVLRGCLLVSGYSDAVGEVTAVSAIRIWPAKRPDATLVVSMGRGMKVDRTPDGWQRKPLEPKSTRLSEELLQRHGWRFDILSPTGTTP